MPFAIPAAIAGLAAGASAFLIGGVTLSAALSIGFGVFAVNLVLGGLAYALAPKPREPVGFGGATIPRDRLITLRGSDEPHRVILGEQDVGGVLRYAEATGASKEYFNIVLALAGHEVYEIGDIWLDNELVGELDGSGNVTTGKFAGFVRIKKYLGTASQTADADLISDSAGGWTSNHNGNGIAYIIVRLKRDDSIFPTGIPQIKTRVKGLKCFDPRTGTTRYTRNPMLQVRELLAANWFMNVGSAYLTDSWFTAQANVCEERVTVNSYASPAFTVTVSSGILTFASDEIQIDTGDKVQVITSGTLPTGVTSGTNYYVIRLDGTRARLSSNYDGSIQNSAMTLSSSGSGTMQLQHIDQARYHSDMTFALDVEPPQIFEALATAYAGLIPAFNGNEYKPRAGYFSSAVDDFTDDHITGPITGILRQGRRDLFNQVKPIYVDAQKKYQISEAPLVTNTVYIGQDYDETITSEIEYPATTNVVRAQRLARYALERVRQGAAYTVPMRLPAFPIELWDIVTLTSSKMGWNADTFRVMDWSFSWESNAGVGIVLSVREEDSNVFGWSASNAVEVPPSPPLVLPDIRSIVAPTGLTAASGTSQLLKAGDGTIISRIQVTWTDGADPNIRYTELQWKLSTDSEWNSTLVPAGGQGYWISPVRDGSDYNLRIRTVSAGFSSSTWVTDTHTVSGKSEAPTAPTTLGVTASVDGFDIAWDECPDVDYWATQIWESSTNDRATATQIVAVSATRTARSGLTGGQTKYYWIRNEDTTGNVSAWYPSGATSGLSATAVQASDGTQVSHPSGTLGNVPDYHDVTTANGDSSVTNPSLNVPTHSDGELLLAAFALRHYTSDVSCDTGGAWTLLVDQQQTNGASASSRLKIFYRRASAEPASYSWTITGGSYGGFAAVSISVTDPNPSNLFADVQSVDTTSGTTHTAPAATAGSADDFLITFHELGTASSFSPTGFTGTERADVPSVTPPAAGITLAAYTRQTPSVGSVGPFSAVAANSAYGATATILISPSTAYLSGGTGNAGYLSSVGYWMGIDAGVYKMHIGDPSGAYLAWDGSALTVKGSLLTGDIEINSAGNVRAGQTAYDTGSGFWVGYSGGAYKLSIGNSGGNKVTWDGSVLTIKGSTLTGDLQIDTAGNIRGGQTAYDTGTGFFLGYSGGGYKLSIGNSAGNKLLWTGSALQITGEITDVRPYAAGSLAIAAASTSNYAPSTSYTKMFSIQVARSGTLTVYFEIGGGVAGGTTYGRIYKNGSAVGTERSVSGTGSGSWSEDIGSLSAGDTIELWGKYSGSGAGYLTGFQLRNAFRIGEFVALQ